VNIPMVYVGRMLVGIPLGVQAVLIGYIRDVVV